MRLKADDGLVEHNMIEYAAERITRFAGRVGYGLFDGFADCDAERAGRIGHFGKNVSAGLCFGARACDAICAPDPHHHFAERLLVETDANHKDLAFEAEQAARKSKGPTPLACAGFGGDSLDAELFIVPGLRNSGIWLVAAGRAECFHPYNKCGREF